MMCPTVVKPKLTPLATLNSSTTDKNYDVYLYQSNFPFKFGVWKGVLARECGVEIFASNRNLVYVHSFSLILPSHGKGCRQVRIARTSYTSRWVSRPLVSSAHDLCVQMSRMALDVMPNLADSSAAVRDVLILRC